MNISGIRPGTGFYDSVRTKEPEEKRVYKLNQVAIRMVDMPPLLSDIPMDNPQAAVEVMADMLKDYDREVLAIINMRSDLKPINMNIVSMGAVDQSIAHPREILKSSILSNATYTMLIHNHPSGRLVPSADDITITDRMNKIADLIGIELVDHIIVGPGKDYFSFKENKCMPLSTLKYNKNLEDIHLRGMKVAETPTKKEIDPFVQELIDKISEAAKENGFHPVEDNKEEPKKRMSVRSKIKGLSKITECMPRKSKTEKSKGERE